MPPLDEIKQRILSHYEVHDTPLLLSNFGKMLRVESIWPIEGETRSLLEVIEGCSPDFSVIRDPNARAFAVVVPQGKEEIANRAIAIRGNIAFLEALPRPVLLSFVVDIPSHKNVYLQTSPVFKYHISDEAPEFQSIIIDHEYRKPGYFIERIRDLDDEKISSLSNSIRQWVSRHSLTLDIFYRKDNREEKANSALSDTKTQSNKISLSVKTTALERLFAAQPDDIASRMVVPVDIAVKLSKMH